MHKKLLITFGCSWTAGDGVGYQPGMTDDEYNTISSDLYINNQFSFRGQLCKKYGYINKNFSIGGTSNATQFRLAKIFFASTEFKQLQTEYNEIVVLWGITSTARGEFYNTSVNHLQTVRYNDPTSEIGRTILTKLYNHRCEVELLNVEMKHWDQFFEHLGVKNFWFDSFNHHHYSKLCVNDVDLDLLKVDYHKSAGADWPTWDEYQHRAFIGKVLPNIANEIFNEAVYHFAKVANESNSINGVSKNLILRDTYQRDLLSQLALNQSTIYDNQQYHYSTWKIDKKIDSNRIPELIKARILAPLGYHPTKYGHELLTEFFVKHIGTFL